MVEPVIKLSSKATSEFWEIPVLFEDEHLLALDKPAGLLSSPHREDVERPNLMRLLHKDIERNAKWVAQRNLTYLANAHRLDFETSGIFLLAKDKPTLIHLANLFGTEKPVRKYLAITDGTNDIDEFEEDGKIGPHPTKPGEMRVDHKEGKKALTKFRVLERFSRHMLVECQPMTGRTHQIRVHLKHVRLYAAGDRVYNGHPIFLSSLKPNYSFKKDVEERPLMWRTALHAAKLEFQHPIEKTMVKIESPMPKDFQVTLKYLRKYTPGRSLKPAGEAVEA